MKLETMREEKPFPPSWQQGGNGFFLPHGLKFHKITISQVFLMYKISEIKAI